MAKSKSFNDLVQQHVKGDKKFAEVLLPVLKKHSQVAPVNDVTAQALRLFHKPAKIRIQLGRAASDVHGGDAGAGSEKFDHTASDAGQHDFRAFGTGVHVAVMAGLIAKFADVDLQRLQRARAKWPFTMRLERCREVAGERKAVESRPLHGRR